MALELGSESELGLGSLWGLAWERENEWWWQRWCHSQPAGVPTEPWRSTHDGSIGRCVAFHVLTPFLPMGYRTSLWPIRGSNPLSPANRACGLVVTTSRNYSVGLVRNFMDGRVGALRRKRWSGGSACDCDEGLAPCSIPPLVEGVVGSGDQLLWQILRLQFGKSDRHRSTLRCLAQSSVHGRESLRR